MKDGPATIDLEPASSEERETSLREEERSRLRYGESVKQVHLDFAPEIKTHGARSLYLRVELVKDGKVVSRQTTFLTAPRYLDLEQGKIETQLKKLGTSRFELTLSSKVFQHAVAFHFRKTAYRAEDNFFDLFPGSKRRIEIRTQKDLSAGGISRSAWRPPRWSLLTNKFLKLKKKID